MIVKLMGGLGNQMFQYAFGISLANTRTEELFFYDATGQQPNGVIWRQWELGAFNTAPKFIVGPQSHFDRGLYMEPHYHYDSNAVNAPRGAFFEGYWQSEKYFKDYVPMVRRAFELVASPAVPVTRIASEIEQAGTGSVALHVRRADYMTPTNKMSFGILSMDYYNRALNYIRERRANTRIFIFSEDVDWCRGNFPPEFRIVETGGKPGKPHEDVWLMSLCHSHITANSTFSWWGAWLGEKPGQIAIAPSQHFRGSPSQSCHDLIPDRWVKLESTWSLI